MNHALPQGIFVTGTDTGVGKTVVCGLLGRFLCARGYKIISQKWVQSGGVDSGGDIDQHLRLMGRSKKEFDDYLSYLSPYKFRFAASCHLAAGLERKTIDPEKIIQAFRFLKERFDLVIVEGSGGALVPFSRTALLIDVARRLDLPVLIVVANKLGAINHSLLSIEAIRRRKMELIGLIFNNQPKKTNQLILKDNPRIIARLSGEQILGILPWRKDKQSLHQAFIPVGKRILLSLRGWRSRLK